MITTPLIDASVTEQVIITLKNGWGIGARAGDTAYVYPRGTADKTCMIKVNNLILPAKDVAYIYFHGITCELILDPTVVGGVRWAPL